MLKPSTCSTCPLYSLGNSFSQPEGQGRTGVFIIGESLQHDDAIESLPFRPKSQAGSKLEECIKSAGYVRNDFRLWNIVACQPPGGRLVGQWFENRAIDSCKQYLKKVVGGLEINEKSKRKVILALGNTAFRVLTGNSASVLDIMGYCFPSRVGLFEEGIITVIAGIHPSYIKKGNAHLTPLLTEHIRKAVDIAAQKEEMEWRLEDMRQEDYKVIQDPNNPVPVGEDEDDIPF